MKLSDEKSKEIKLPRSAKIFVIIGCLLTGVPSIFMLVSFVADFNEQISLIFSSEFGYNYFMNLLFSLACRFSA
ncbi:hypothetical protein [Ohessyouella blattaphilus]|uniref:Uncharacterized protein n=1 Tax=Ohessyouella blattaphilus TaxID=2949333 RepID=A0ABT1EGF4_9FIRM|nr:hypothetical protein [Ohessyouella blattaphilus]MCP1109564.1 hypothetical protein [Ohessyouella blattaphilus]MCR8562958.1 hypothetical protein [Ohessyouella blattaphilus]